MIIHQSLSDFILFLYVHIAHSDANYDPSEMALIKTKMAQLFADGIDIEKKLYGAIREYNSFDKVKLEELFNDSVEHFKSGYPMPDNDLFSDIEEIIRADGKVHVKEVDALTLISNIVNKAIK